MNKNRIRRSLLLSLPLTLSLALPAHSEDVAEKSSASIATVKSLPISDGSLFTVNASLPKFSWDVTPQYFMFGDTKRLLTPEEVKSIAARTDFICIEKSHGFKEVGAAELGAKHEAAAFKKANPDMKVLFYFNSAYAYPHTSYTKNMAKGVIDKHPELKKFILTDPKTGEMTHRSNIYQFDVLNPEFRDWWSDTVAKGVVDSGCDGAFIDQMHGFTWLRADDTVKVRKAMGDMMADLKKKIGPDKILLGNNAHQKIAEKIFPVVDATMFEHYSAKLISKEALLKNWEDMLNIAKAGKMSIFRIGLEYDTVLNMKQLKKSEQKAKAAEFAKENVEYYLSVYLIGAQPYSYFQYGWGWTLSSGSLQDYPILHKRLGAPKAAYTRVHKDGWEFTREFEHASVWVDTEKKKAKITWK